MFFTTRGTEPDAILAAAGASPRFDSTRHVVDTGDRSLFEAVVTGGTLPRAQTRA